MKITNAIVRDHRGRAKEGGPGELEVRITINRKSYYIGTGIRVRKSEFVAGRIMNCMGADELNDRLAIIFRKVMAEVNDAVEHNAPIDTAKIRKKVWGIVVKMNNEPVFIQWCEKQIPLLNVSKDTKRFYTLLVSRLYEFEKIRTWDDLTVENISNFDSWLHNFEVPRKSPQPDGEPKLLSDGTIYNYHKNLKALINRAVLFGVIDSNPYDKLKGKISRGEKENVEYLTEDEMQRIENLELPEGSRIDRARDIFVFQMFTGLAYSDAQAFDLSQYKWDGERWLRTGERIKTGSPYVSVLLPPVVKVLDKYGWSVPKMNNADYNLYLKKIGAMADIKTRMHTHLARHTFATQMLSNDVKIQNVSKMLGHKNIQQTMRYAKVLAQDVRNDFEMIERKLKK